MIVHVVRKWNKTGEQRVGPHMESSIICNWSLHYPYHSSRAECIWRDSPTRTRRHVHTEDQLVQITRRVTLPSPRTGCERMPTILLRHGSRENVDFRSAFA